MANIDIDSYRANFNGGARAFMFYYKPIFPTQISGIGIDTDSATYLVRATSLPETSTEEIVTNWQGFDFKFAGKYTYTDWTVTFNCDSKADIQQIFHEWANLVHDPTSNYYTDPSIYMQDQEVQLIGTDGAPIQRYKLYGAWPKTVGSATLDYSNNDVVQFDISFAYIYHVASKVNYSVMPSFAG